MSSVDSERKKFYQTVLKNNGMAESIKDMQIRVPEELHGEHFASICEYVTIQLEGGKEMHFFVKRPTTNPEHATMLDYLDSFAKEAGAFNTLLKDMQQFYAERTKSSNRKLDLLPKCYYADASRIVLENLKKREYFLMNKVVKMDIETTKFALTNYAQFHAVAYAMGLEIGNEKIISKYPCIKEGMLKEGQNNSQISRMYFIPLLQNTNQILKSAGNIEGKDFALSILAKFHDHKLVFDDMVASCRNQDGSHFLPLINHGDSWLNNIMWHRDPATQTLDHLILCDFQQMRFASPNMDLSYLFYTSIKGEDRRKNFKTLCEFYFSKLKEFSLDLGVPFEHDLQDLLNDYKDRSSFGFWVGLFMLIAYEALSGYDTENEEGEFSDNVNSLISKFTSKYPEKTVLIATEICAMFKERFGSD